MRYDLPAMVKASARRRRPRPVRMRLPLQKFQLELERIYLDVVDFWSRASKDPVMVTDADVPDAEEVRSVTEETFIAAILVRLRNWVMRLATWMRDLWVRRILESTDIDVSSFAEVPASAPAVLETVAWAEDLVKDLSQQTKTRVASAIADAKLRDLPQTAARQVVAEALDKAKSRANLIAEDMVGKFHGRMNQTLQEEGNVRKYKWNHSFRPNPRRHHVERQGNIYEWAKPPSDGHPGYAIRCRCTAEPVI